eukprot:1140398-Pelagomonas_calceolata.AAC.1
MSPEIKRSQFASARNERHPQSQLENSKKHLAHPTEFCVWWGHRGKDAQNSMQENTQGRKNKGKWHAFCLGDGVLAIKLKMKHMHLLLQLLAY